MSLIHLIVLLGVEHAPERRRDPKQGEVVAGDHFGIDPLGLVVDAHRGRDEAAAQHVGQRLCAFLEVLIQGIRVHPRSHIAPHVRALLVEHDQLLRGGDGELAQKDLVGQGENCGVGADAQGQRKDRHGREEGAAAKSTQREAKV